jgi:hypothetical protein
MSWSRSKDIYGAVVFLRENRESVVRMKGAAYFEEYINLLPLIETN